MSMKHPVSCRLQKICINHFKGARLYFRQRIHYVYDKYFSELQFCHYDMYKIFPKQSNHILLMDSLEYSKNTTAWTVSIHNQLRVKWEQAGEKPSLQIHLCCFISCVCICAHTYSIQSCGPLTASFTRLHHHITKDLKQYGYLCRNYNSLLVMRIVQ